MGSAGFFFQCGSNNANLSWLSHASVIFKWIFVAISLTITNHQNKLLLLGSSGRSTIVDKISVKNYFSPEGIPQDQDTVSPGCFWCLISWEIQLGLLRSIEKCTEVWQIISTKIGIVVRVMRVVRNWYWCCVGCWLLHGLCKVQ